MKDILSAGSTAVACSASIVFAGDKLNGFAQAELNSVLNDRLLCILSRNLIEYLQCQSILTLPEILLLEVDEENAWKEYVKQIKTNSLTQGIIIVLLSSKKDSLLRKEAMKSGIHDLYCYPFPLNNISERLDFLAKFKLIRPRIIDLSKKVDLTYRIPFAKRLLDILVAGGMLILLSPLLLLVALFIKIDSKGPIFYISKRVGTGFHVFNFYKFRSMRSDADKLLTNLSALNQYAGDGKDTSAFIKIKNDPRVTKLGNFLRNSSIDELPQLLNVLIGDMSLVGNRPLPIYEAERLTSNEWSMRFLGPAGLTGLWQISKRGKQDMSERERMKLDNFYAKKHSFWFDISLLLRTIPAVFQKEKV